MCKNAGGDMHRVDETETFFNLAFIDGFIDLRRNVHDRVSVLRVHPEIFGVGFHHNPRYLVQLTH